MDHSAPNSQNQYLHAQEGLFIHPTYGCAHYARNGQWPNLETFAVAVAQELSEPTIRKLTLPYAQVGELMRLLWLNGVSRAHLMPTLDNVTQCSVLEVAMDSLRHSEQRGLTHHAPIGVKASSSPVALCTSPCSSLTRLRIRQY